MASACAQRAKTRNERGGGETLATAPEEKIVKRHRRRRARRRCDPRCRGRPRALQRKERAGGVAVDDDVDGGRRRRWWWCVGKLLVAGIQKRIGTKRYIGFTLARRIKDLEAQTLVDNDTREGLGKFLEVANSIQRRSHYEFMQDYKVHLKHLDGHIKEVPYFRLPANELVDVIPPSCYRCGCEYFKWLDPELTDRATIVINGLLRKLDRMKSEKRLARERARAARERKRRWSDRERARAASQGESASGDGVTGREREQQQWRDRERARAASQGESASGEPGRERERRWSNRERARAAKERQGESERATGRDARKKTTQGRIRLGGLRKGREIKTILLLVGTKLELVIMEMAQQIQDRTTVVKRAPTVEPSNKLFWFNRPEWILLLIHFTLFQGYKSHMLGMLKNDRHKEIGSASEDIVNS
ncbi:hypothetical protein Syun_009121 [Stephania yunnanensis]|uniref:MLO-like protein n=1 Tax=Stephania yunnanensis TaxID=152371 RepID=A0AAP0KGD1_9MAGN